MKTKSIVLASLLSTTLFANHQAFAGCRVGPTAHIQNGAQQILPAVLPSQGADSEIALRPVWDDTLDIPLMGDRLGTDIGVREGTDIVARGPVRGGFVAFVGNDIAAQGSLNEIESFIRVSINWSPDTREVCTKHKTVFGKGRKCVEKGIETLPTSFIVDITTDGGTVVHYRAQFNNVNNVQNALIVMPKLQCDTPINHYEARISGLAGGSVEFKVHQMNFHRFLNY
jgi:hypothetical protein